MKIIKQLMLLLLCTIAVSTVIKAQQTTKDIRQLVESQNFVFKAESANPARGGTKILSPGYDLTVTKNNVVSYLPFYGRAQTIPINAADGGIKFTSTNFEYKPVLDNKTWHVTIKINDVTHVQQLYLTIYDNGTADLEVMNINRDNMSFRGYIQ